MGKRVSAAVVVLALWTGAALAEETAGVWNLTDLYPNDASWEKARGELTTQVADLGNCKGQLGSNADTLSTCLKRISDTYRQVLRLFTYSYLTNDTDLASSTFRERQAVAQTLVTHYEEVTSFLEPELLALDATTLQRLVGERADLADFDFLIRNTRRKAAHVLSPREEEILAAASNPLQVAHDAYGVLTNAEMPWPEITLSDQTKIRLTPSAYTKYRSVANREDRQAVFENFFATYQQYSQTLAVLLEGSIKANAFEARMRGYPSSLAMALATDNIPEDIYRTLIASVGNHLDTLHRYLSLRDRILGIKDAQYHDVYASAVDYRQTYGLTQAKYLTAAAVTPLGTDYQARLAAAFNSDWMHVYPRGGKTSGAYSMGSAYDTHPYVLLNYNDDFESLTTFAHEWGHAMHTVLANASQPFAKADYPAFLAEVASTANEVLLYNYLRSIAHTDTERLYYLFQELDGLRGTFFRQTQFAEFELAIHEQVEHGSGLSGKKLNALYGDILRRYYGDEEGVITIDHRYSVEWAYVPHFYSNYYVYQYATSIAAAYYLMEKVLNGGDQEREQYLSILKAGGSDYPYDILKRAGADMAKPEVYEAVIRRAEDIMDEIETILADQAKSEPVDDKP
ncbi:MAG: oligoendopeptidase F [Porticoccaceae bacterium]